MHVTSENWTIYEAIHKIVPPELINEYALARLEARKVPRIRLRSDFNGPNPEYPGYLASDFRVKKSRYAIENHLVTRLKNDLTATGRYGTAIAVPDVLPPSIWAHFWFYNWQKSTAFERATKTTIYDVRISRKSSQRSGLRETRSSEKMSKPAKSDRKVPSKANEGKACERWLTQWMRCNRSRRIATHAKWYERAIEYWKSLSKRQFRSAWNNAIDKARAPAWSARQGAPRKTDIKDVPKWPAALTPCVLVETSDAPVRDQSR
jgi:hypothetical protein